MERNKVESDHKPLEVIVKKPLYTTSPRLQRFLLRLKKYQFSLQYVSGKQMHVAGALSRAHLSKTSEGEDEVECQVHLLVQNLPISDEKTAELRKKIEKNETMHNLRAMIRSGWPENGREISDDLKPFWNSREELYEAEGLLFKGSKVVIPDSLRKEMLVRIHEGHLGMQSCKHRAREELYWPA